MKNVIIISVFILLNVITGCSKEESTKLIGKWKVDSEANFPIFTFKSNGDYSEQWDANSNVVNGTYIYDKDRIKLSNDVTYLVVKLSNSELVLSTKLIPSVPAGEIKLKKI